MSGPTKQSRVVDFTAPTDVVAPTDARPSRSRERNDRGGPSTAKPRDEASVAATWSGTYLAVRTLADLLAAAVLLVALLPVILLAALAVKLTSRGPAFYLQTRTGRNGRDFRLIKLRTMVVDAEAATGAVWATHDDPRVTAVGRFLRDTHLDELPQLVNVLQGHMALVGPRPERPEFVARLKSKLPNYARRHAVRPGITGLAQVRLPPDTDVESVRRKLAHDLWYVDRAGPWLDVRILVATAGRFLTHFARSLFALVALPSRDHVERTLLRHSQQPR